MNEINIFYTQKVKETVPRELQAVCWQLLNKRRRNNQVLALVQRFEFTIQSQQLFLKYEDKNYSKVFEIKNCKHLFKGTLWVIVQSTRATMVFPEEVNEEKSEDGIQ
ncbi:hypothetical protein FC19_GL002038 [Liquorilactobacillus aquaticus DSM 21051]|uniref:DUF960 domain-containing protein n=1 Tax=Liquorilactobacillus aquaticus DSM 21051 TaxID=1423725 RepID=A0A0R2D5B8_9LACO|nr:DUF960 family protein [Liquorilactobacillus aquaticus]KRM95420.1 hypothetical protein FC19_GL002038 [Liquorilactobacillus aquaticus DSM 21051]